MLKFFCLFYLFSINCFALSVNLLDCNQTAVSDLVIFQPLISADKILVFKSERKLFLLKSNVVLRSYHISLGFSPEGPKIQQGDGKTPEGLYFVDYKNPSSQFHLSLGLSYPDADDVEYAQSLGLQPGGNIMIHGFPNNADLYEQTTKNHLTTANWTSGCIAVNDFEIEEIYEATNVDTQVRICP